MKLLNYTFFGLLLSTSIFVSSNSLTDTQILPKWYVFVAFSLLWSICFFMGKRKITLRFTSLAMGIIVFAAYLFFRFLINLSTVFQVLSIPCFLLLFAILRNFAKEEIDITNRIIAFVVVSQSIYALFQLTGWVHNPTSFRIVGSFDNPAGLAVCLSIGLPYCLYMKCRGKIEKFIRVLFIITLWTALLLSESRTGVLASLVVVIIFIFNKYKRQIKYTKQFRIAMLFILFMLAPLLFFFKKDSSLGRMLIWKNSLTMFVDAPVWGNGSGAFQADYMRYQAAYFENVPESKYAQLADNVQHPFNEYILLLVEHGIVGMLFFCVVLVLLFKNLRSLDNPYMLSIIVIGITALFSYPFKYAYTLIILAYALAIISAEGNVIRTVRLGIPGRVLILLFSAAGCWMLVKDIAFEYKWNKAVNLVTSGKEDEAKIIYKELYSDWNHDPLFLYNYGTFLHTITDYTVSNKIMHKCEKYYNDYDVQMIIAYNFQHQKEWKKAEEKYIMASNMCPNRFMPLYGLFTIYRKKEDIEKAKEAGTIILEKPVKVRSGIIDYIQKEVRDFMNAEMVND